MIGYYLDGWPLVADIGVAAFLLATVRHLTRKPRP